MNTLSIESGPGASAVPEASRASVAQASFTVLPRLESLFWQKNLSWPRDLSRLKSPATWQPF